MGLRAMNLRDSHEEIALTYLDSGLIDGRMPKAVRMFLRHVPRVSRLLDIGCGDGHLTLYMKQALSLAETHGVEISQTNVKRARSKGIHASLVDIGVEALPFEDSSFDAIFCGELIEHLLDPDHLLDEIYRVLDPAGVCVLTTPNLAAWFHRLALLVGWQPSCTAVSFHHRVGVPRFLPDHILAGGGGTHIRVFTYCALRELVEIHGFRAVAVEGLRLFERTPGLPRFLQWVVGQPDRFLGLFPSLAGNIVMALKKR
jgi:methionine biosynthesis protein MetW